MKIRYLILAHKNPAQFARLISALETPAAFFYVHIDRVDDDIFFTPGQWAQLFKSLLRDEAAPGGVTGDLYRPGTTSSNGSPFHHLVGRETDMDLLIGAYAFASEHLKRVFELAAKIGISDLSRFRNGEDILLSFAGTKPPSIHPLKPALVCASASLPGVALWKSDHEFWNERVRIFESARDVRLALDSPWFSKSEFEQQVSQP